MKGKYYYHNITTQNITSIQDLYFTVNLLKQQEDISKLSSNKIHQNLLLLIFQFIENLGHNKTNLQEWMVKN